MGKLTFYMSDIVLAGPLLRNGAVCCLSFAYGLGKNLLSCPEEVKSKYLSYLVPGFLSGVCGGVESSLTPGRSLAYVAGLARQDLVLTK